MPLTLTLSQRERGWWASCLYASMSINVVCPGCMKRFQVGDRFAGQKGPCPNCNTIINIPKAEVKIHTPDEFAQGGKTSQGKLLLKPIARIDVNFNPTRAVWVAGGALVVVLLAWLLGRMELSVGTRDLIGGIGLLLIGFPLSLFGYYVMRDREELFILTGEELNKKTAICAAAYAVLWILYETFAWYMSADLLFIWVYFAVAVAFSMFITHVVFDVNLGQATLHALIFYVSVVFLRGMMGLGWLWIAYESGRRNTMPLPDFW